MHVVVANVKCNPRMSQAKVEHDLRFIASLGAIFFGSEIEIPRYKQAWTAILRHAKRAVTFNISIECPIAVPTKWWTPIRSERVLTHHGRALTTPDRYLSLLFVHARRKPSLGICFIGTHYVSGGWHKGFKAFKAWRRKVWGIHHGKHQAAIADALAAGYNVVTGGDFNRTGDMRLHPDAVLIAQHGLDHLYAIPAPGYRVHIDHEPEVVHPASLNTDHPILVGHFHFEAVV